MGERKGTNKYYPPDFDPEKHRNLAGYTGQHPLRERARKLHMGILIIRFEMPYNIWCDGCNNHIGMGVRYNAEKSKVGMYYTTPIYKFRMKCHLCNNHFEIKTDPANHDYVIISGARRKEQRWDPKENEQIVPEDRDSQKKLATDAMYKLEHGVEDKGKGTGAKSSLARIADAQAGWKDDYALNQMARHKFRTEKKAIKESGEEEAALLRKSSLNMELVEEQEEDIRMAQLLKYSSNQDYEEKQKQRRQAIQNRPLFGQKSAIPGNRAKSSPFSTPSSSSDTSNDQDTQKLKHLANIQRMVASNRTPAKGFGEPTSPSSSSSGVGKALTGNDLGIVSKAKKNSLNRALCQNVEKKQASRDQASTSSPEGDFEQTMDQPSAIGLNGSSGSEGAVQQESLERQGEGSVGGGLGALMFDYGSSESSSGGE